MGGFGLQPHGRAGEVDHDELLACLLEGGNHVALDFRQLDARAVSAFEAFGRHAHGFPFQQGRDAAGEDDDVRLFQPLDERLHVGSLLLDEVKVQERVVLHLLEGKLDAVFLARLEGEGVYVGGVLQVVLFADFLSVDEEFHPPVGREAELRGARVVGAEDADVASGEVLQVDPGGKGGGTLSAVVERRLDLVGGCDLTLCLPVVPVGGGESRLAVHRAVREEAVPDAALGVPAERFVDDLVFGQTFAQCLQEGHGV